MHFCKFFQVFSCLSKLNHQEKLKNLKLLKQSSDQVFQSVFASIVHDSYSAIRVSLLSRDSVSAPLFMFGSKLDIHHFWLPGGSLSREAAGFLPQTNS